MKTLKQSTLLIMAFSIATRLMSFFFKIYLSRRVGAEILGLFQMTFSVFGLFYMIAGSGIPLMLSRKTAELSAFKGREKELDGVVTGAILLSLGIVLLLIGGTLIFRKGLPLIFSDRRCVKLFLLLLPALLSTVIYQLLRAYFMGRGRFFDYSVTELSEEAIKIVACLTFLSNGVILLSDSVAITIAFLVTDYAVMVLLLVLYFIKGGRFAKPCSTKAILRASLPVTGMRVAAGLLTSFIAICLPAALVRNGMTPGDATAEYGRAVGMAFSLLFAPLSLTSALSIVILPKAASLAATGEWKELRLRVNESILFIFAITVLFYVLFLVLGESFGELLFKDARAGRFVSFSSGMVVPAALSGLINTTLNSLGEEKKVFLSFSLSSALLILCVIFLPRYIGIYALSIGECAFYLTDFILGMCFLWKRGGYSAAIFKPAAIMMTLAFPTALSAKLCQLLLPAKGIFLRTALPTIVGCLVYLLLLLLFKPIPEIRTMILKNPLKRKKKRMEKEKSAHSGPSSTLSKQRSKLSPQD